MGSREKEQTTQHHQSHISSLVVRESGSDGGEGGRNAAAGDYEPGEINRDPSSYSRLNRYKSENAALACKNLGLEEGHRTRASSSSPIRHPEREHRHGSDLDHSGGRSRVREFSSRKEAHGRHRDYSPPYARGGAGARPYGRGLDGPELARGPLKSEGMSRNNNPNVQPREGDWYCPDPLCKNLNFARREYCNNCKKPRYTPEANPQPPRRDYAISPPHHPPPRRLPAPPMDLSPGRSLNGYRSPPRGWPRGTPRGYPLPRHDHPAMRHRDRHYSDWDHADGRRDRNPKPSYHRRPPLSPPPQSLPPPGKWGRVPRERSRSPIRTRGPPPLSNYDREASYIERGREDRRDRGGRPARGRMGNAY